MERCFLCGQLFNNCKELQQHYPTSHKPSRKFIVKESAFQRKFVTFRYNFLPEEKYFLTSQKGILNLIVRQIMGKAARHLITRISLIFIAKMVMTDGTGTNITRASIPFCSPSLMPTQEIQSKLEKWFSSPFDNNITPWTN